MGKGARERKSLVNITIEAALHNKQHFISAARRFATGQVTDTHRSCASGVSADLSQSPHGATVGRATSPPVTGTGSSTSGCSSQAQFALKTKCFCDPVSGDRIPSGLAGGTAQLGEV